MTTSSAPAQFGHATPAAAGRPTRPRRGALAVAIAALLLAVSAVSASASPAVLRVIDASAPSYGRAIPVAAAGGGTFTADPGRALVTLTPRGAAGTSSSAWCVDRLRSIEEGADRAVDLQTPADTPALAAPGMQAAGWLIAAADGLIARAPDPGREAAAVQLAIWRLTGQAADVLGITPDLALNARAHELRELARGMTPVTALALSGPGGTVAVGSPVPLTVTATPGAVVDLTVTAGATLSAAQVPIGPGGSATVTVAPATAGSVVVTATARGGSLARAAHLPGATGPQDMALITPTTLTASATLAAAAPLVTPAGAPAVPVTRVTPARLVLRKSGAARAIRGGVILYTLTITNRSAVTARGVVLRDPLPAGAFVARLPARARLAGGAIVWNIGSLAPRASVTVRLRLGTRLAPLGALVNRASASAGNAATVRARAVTRILAAPRTAPRVMPAVTG